MPRMADISSNIEGFANRLALRLFQVQIGASPAAVISPNPNVTAIASQDINNIVGAGATDNTPSRGVRIVIPRRHVHTAIAAGLVEREATLAGQPTELAAAQEFYRFAFEPGSCLSSVPSDLNTALGARWLVTMDDGVQYEHALIDANTEKSPHYLTLSFARCSGHSSMPQVLLT